MRIYFHSSSYRSLAPPAIDLQMRSIYNEREGEVDSRGVDLIHCLLHWFIFEFETGHDFQVMEAYLARFLHIYSELLVKECAKNPLLRSTFQELQRIHQEKNEKFRMMIQSNLCVLKMLAQITSV